MEKKIRWGKPKKLPNEQASNERRKKAPKESARKAVGDTSIPANQLAAPSYKVGYVAIDAINVNFTNNMGVPPALPGWQ